MKLRNASSTSESNSVEKDKKIEMELKKIPNNFFITDNFGNK